MIFTTPYHQPAPAADLPSWWGVRDASVSKTSNPWIGGDATGRIAALKMLDTLILMSILLMKSPDYVLRLQLYLISEYQGNIFALVHSHTWEMQPIAFRMQLIFLLHVKCAQIAPSHCIRDHNQCADDLTHSDPNGFTSELRIDINPIFRSFSLFPQILPDWQPQIIPT
eukprot:s78_g26.t1